MLLRGKAGSSVGDGFCSGLSTSPWLPKGWPRLRSIWTGPLRVACALNGDGLTQWGEGHQWSTNGEGGAGLRESLPKINQCPQRGKKLVRSEKIRTVSKKTKHLGGEKSSPSKHQKVENLFFV